MNADHKHPVFRILVIDDNQAIHEDFRKILMQNKNTNTALDDLESALFGSETQVATTLNFELDEASQGAEGLAMVEAAVAEGRPYALAFVDGRMPPGWDGIETISHLWQADPDLQTVLCTAYADYSWQEIRKILGETDSLLILKKPFDNIEVQQLAHTLTRKWELSQEIKGRLHRLAYYDSLTGLPNRALFMNQITEKVKQIKAEGTTAALFFIDLDNFKRINDTLGHSFGDDLLKIIARRLDGCIRESDLAGYLGEDCGVSRLGGDEFTVLLQTATCPTDVADIAQRVLNKLSRPIELGPHKVMITPSIGIAMIPEDGDTVEDILKNADLAMYYAKRNGSNSFHFFQQSMNSEALKRLIVETQLRQALQREEFSLVYQPQYELQTGALSGLEALLRWHNHELGQVPPLEFIPVAEESGLILPIGEWVLRTACIQAKLWLDAGISVPRISVNISPIEFMQRNFVDYVKQVLQETGLPAAVLQLEITESLLFKEPDNCTEKLHGLNEIGVEIAIDDFGTGYSNLSRLRDLPINCLKIDRSFVYAIDGGKRNQSILGAIIAMASGMELDLIAEGVETDIQLNFLKQESCNEAQGYLFSRPLTLDNTTNFLQELKQLQKKPS